MKRLYWLITVLFISGFSFAQDNRTGSLTVFSAEEEPFFLYVDGFRYNELPGKEVRVTGLTQLFVNIKLEYADKKLGSVSRNKLSVSDGEDNLMDVRYKVSRQQNSIRLRFYSMNPVKAVNIQEKLEGTKPVTTETSSSTGCITVFSEEGDNFFLYVNGMQQNTIAQSRIRVEGLTELFCQVKVVFANKQLSGVTRNNLSVSDGDDQLMDASYKLSRSGNSGKLRFYSMNPVIDRTPIQPGTAVYQWGKPDVKMVAAKSEESRPVIKVIPQQEPANAPVQKTAIETPSSPVVKEIVTEQKPVKKNDVAIEKTKPSPVKVEAEPAKINNGQIAEPDGWLCENEWPIWKADLSVAMKNIESAKSEKEKMELAEKLLKGNCFNTDQLIDIARLFPTEDGMLAFVQSAFSHSIDFKNYHRMQTLFKQSVIKDKLNRFLHSRKP